MSIRAILAVLTMSLLLAGFLTNSVMQRVIGPVEGSHLWPLAVLVLVLAISMLQIYKIDSYLKANGH